MRTIHRNITYTYLDYAIELSYQSKIYLKTFLKINFVNYVEIVYRIYNSKWLHNNSFDLKKAYYIYTMYIKY